MADAHLYRQRLALLLLDVLAFLVAFVVAMHLRFDAQLSFFEPGRPPWEPMLQSIPVMLGVWLATLASCGLYGAGRRRIFFELGRLVQALLVMAGVLLSATFFYRGFSYSRGFAMLFLPLTLATTFLGRVLYRVVRARIEEVDRGRYRVLLLGGTQVARHLAAASATPGFRFDIAGALDDEQPAGTELGGGVRVLGPIRALVELAREHGVRGVIVTNPKLDDGTQLALLETCMGANLEWRVVPSAFEIMLDRVEFDSVAGVPLLGLRRSNIRGGNRLVKRLFDVVAASFALLLLSPLMAVVAALIKLTSRGPVLFAQSRVGENGEPFRFLKFRSMHVGNDDSIHREYTRKLITEGTHAVQAAHDGKGAVYKLKDDPRLIPIGKFIRKYSIDELPQLFNVLKGDMSLIGPRPPIPYEVEVYRQWHKRRFEGPPGITGLWQVSGRNRLSFEEMVKLDIEYLENWSFRRDLLILWRTMGVVLFDRAL
jgi:exopolysaccharide biosynthesis polyprenyl glycosylphosphotransferase